VGMCPHGQRLYPAGMVESPHPTIIVELASRDPVGVDVGSAGGSGRRGLLVPVQTESID